MGLLKKALLIAFFAWLMLRFFTLCKIFCTMGSGIPVFNHAPGPCRMFHVNGSEDIDVLPSGLAIFSSGLKYQLSPHGVDPSMLNYKGMIYSFDLNTPTENPRPIPFENFDDSTFSPHGIHLYIDPQTQDITLFVINHGGEKHSIEIFHFNQTKMVLRHSKTVVDETIYSPNDVVAVGTEKFYVVNDHYFSNTLLSFIEYFYPLEWGNVVFYDGTHSKLVADHLNFADGITIDASGKYVFVTSALEGTIVIYERIHGNDLIERQRIHIGVALDNIVVDENGDLWLGVGSLAIIDYSLNFTKPCPGKVLQVKLSKNENSNVPFKVTDIHEVFSNSGDGTFKCVSTALFYRGKLLVGNPFSNLMFCEIVAI